ncbi:MAG: phosphoribosyltransferase family protein [Eubacteriales bacterium]|nr:phosphoribosyltransferase family protein [Eubacteriales bacterium]MDD3881818.1 phosphoribosyltransferase family protein [Eubacteriales bacterium]MDD4513685.1 phosphoribosyltransferase family protein [Eubacteriales bacterium]
MNCAAFLRVLKKGLTDLLYPPHAVCAVCGDKRSLQSETDFVCLSCREKLLSYARPVDICEKCNQRMGRGKHVCRLMSLSGIAFAYPYSYAAARGAVRAIKFHSLPQIAGLLAPALSSCCRRFPVDVIVPVPLSAKRRGERGFNQSEEISARVAALLGLAVDSSSLVRMRDTKAQSGLQKSKRRKNVSGAFGVNGGALSGKQVLLIDDVVTTGSTADACAKALLAAGAKSVYLGAVCGTYRRRVSNAQGRKYISPHNVRSV